MFGGSFRKSGTDWNLISGGVIARKTEPASRKNSKKIDRFIFNLLTDPELYFAHLHLAGIN